MKSFSKFVYSKPFTKKPFDEYSLKKIEFADDSKLQIIDDYAFYNTSIESISIPSHVNQIGKCAFGCFFLNIIEFDENLEIESINQSIFHNCFSIIMVSVNLIDRVDFK